MTFEKLGNFGSRFIYKIYIINVHVISVLLCFVLSIDKVLGKFCLH